ncbi:MAG: protease complex subunit PrcB family protein [Candidatus Sericytochromatia bacterium]|nr:protease complex subunit PrcB family protein [Candidatus Sericytochromatia bacterium]
MSRLLIACLMIGLAGTGCSQTSFGGSTTSTNGSTIQTTTVAQGADSLISQRRRVAIKDDAAWTALWKEHRGSDAGRPNVDFSKEMVLAAFTGEQLTAGYEVKIGSLNIQGNRVLVNIREITPSSSTVTAQVITTPFHLVKAPRRTEEVVFIEAP